MSVSLTPASNDVAVKLLSMVLGPGWNSWATGGSASGAGGVLGTMFMVLNTSLLTLAAGILVYTHAVGAADMARQGQSKVNTWTFLRQSTAMMMLAPVPWASGMNVLQVLVMLAASWSVGIADNVWSAAVQYVASNGGQIQPANGVTPVSESVLAGMLKSGIIAASLQQQGYTVTMYSEPAYGPGNPDAPGSQGAQDGMSFGFQASGAGTIPPSAIGLVTVRCKPAICPAVGKGLQTVATDLQPAVADAMSWTNSGQDGTKIPAGIIQKAASDYAAAVSAAVASDASSQNSALSQSLSSFQSSAQAQGWAAAGIYFYQLSNFNAEAGAQDIDMSYASPDMAELNGVVTSGAKDALALVDQYLQDEKANAFGGSAMLAGAGASAAPGGTCPSITDGAWNWVSCHVSAPLLWTNSLLINSMTGGSGTGQLGATGVDAIAGIQSASNLGINMIYSGFAGWAGINALAAGTEEAARQAAADGRSVPIVGALAGLPGGAASSLAAGAVAGLKAISPFFWTTSAVALALLSVGAYYLPLLPAVIYTMAVIGWMIVVLEMLVAAPLWAFSHVLPEGDGMLGSSARAGYFHMLDILARPILLVFGLLLTILMMNAAVYFLGTGLQIAFASEMQGKVVGPLSAMAELFIVMGAIYMLTNQVVHLISKVPRTVMRWLGQSMGVDGNEIEAERHLNALASARIGGALKGGGGGLAGAADKFAKEQAQGARGGDRGAENAAASEAQAGQAELTPEPNDSLPGR
ncbi:MAG: DotA/TraY family protein [Burkholderiales bacterium]|nr:DotA/TraY family protein [Burkholderiales bacterium]